MCNLFSVLTSPAATFERLRGKGGWVVPLLVIMLITLLNAWLMMPALEGMIDDQLQKQAELAGQASPGLADFTKLMSTIGAFAGAVFGPLITMFFGGVLLLLVNLIVRGEATYMQLSKVSLFSMVPGLVSGLISGILVRVTGATSPMDVMLNAGAFLSEKTGFLYSFLSILDPFKIWGLVLLIIGTAVMARKSRGSVAIWIVLGWLIVSIIGALAAGLGSMFTPQ